MDQRILTALIAVIGIPILLVGYIQVGEWILSRLPRRIAQLMRPYVWVFPAVGFATVFMVLPTINTIVISFQNAKGEPVGLDNYVFFFTNPETLTSLNIQHQFFPVAGSPHNHDQLLQFETFDTMAFYATVFGRAK